MRTAPAAGTSSGPAAKYTGRHHTGPSVLPSTTTGRVSLAAATLTLACLGFMVAVDAAGLTADATLSQTPWLGVPAALVAVLVLVTTVLGTVALLARGERSLLVLLATAAGLVLVYSVIGELFGFH